MAGPPTPLMGNLFWTLKGNAAPVAKPATRVTIVPLKPGSQEAVKAGLGEVDKIMKGSPVMGKMIEVGAFFTDDDKMVGRTLFTDMDALTGSAEATKKVMGGMAEHFAGPPSMSMGTVDWHFKGPAAPVATPVSRVTIVPIKPGAQGAIMTKNMIETIEKGLDDPAMLADYYANVFGYHKSDLPEERFLLQGPGRRLVVGGGGHGTRAKLYSVLVVEVERGGKVCLLYTSPSPRDS